MFDFKTVFFYAGVVIVCSLLANSAEKKPKIWKAVLIISVLTFVAGCRANTVGNDTMGYYKMFQSNATYGFIREYAFGYYIKILMKIFKNANLCILATSFITNALIICGFWKIRDVSKFKYNVIAYVFIPFFLTMSGLRQWLAISIIVYFFNLILEKKYIKFSLAVVLASLFHTSSLVALAYVVISVITEKEYIKTFKSDFRRFFIIMVSIPALYLAVRYSMSEYSSYFENLGVSDRGGILMNFFRVVILLVFLFSSFFYKEMLKKRVTQTNDIAVYEKKQTLISIAVFGYLFYIILGFIGQYVENVARIAWPFLITQGFIYGMFDEADVDWGKLGKTLLLVLFLYHLYSTIFHNGNGLTPYIMFWEQV